MPNIPDTAVRKACLDLLNGIGTPIFETLVPKDVTIPAQRVIISTQTDAQHSTSKCGHLWNHTILFDIISEQPVGYSDKSVCEAIWQAINSVLDIQGDIPVDGFTIYNTQVLNSHDIELTTDVKSINRKLVRYGFIIG